MFNARSILHLLQSGSDGSQQVAREQVFGNRDGERAFQRGGRGCGEVKL